MAAIESASDTFNSYEDYYRQLFIELADLFGGDVLLGSQLMSMNEMFKHSADLDVYVQRLREIAIVNGNIEEYRNIIDTINPELSVALCKWIADGWACDIKH